MRTIPITLLLAMTLAAATSAGTATDSTKAAKPTAEGAASGGKAAPPVSGTPAVLRASGTLAQPGSAAETLDTASEEPEAGMPSLSTPTQPAPALPASASPAAAATPPTPLTAPVLPRKLLPDSLKLAVEPVAVEAPKLSRLEIGGTFALKAFHHDFTASSDADKKLSFALRRARVDFLGDLGGNFGFEGQFGLGADGQKLGAEAVYLSWKYSDLFGIKGGKLKRPFSQEAMQSSKGLYTVERGGLYQSFLSDVTGYSSYDLGLVFHGGFVDDDVPVTYEAGLFNGKQSDDPVEGYANQHYQGQDKGLKSKDLAFRLLAQPFHPLKVEASISTKATEDKSDPSDFAYHVNTGYEVGADFSYGRLRLLGEAAWGDNHHGRDARIISGTTLFFAFYGTAVWHEDYTRGRASELVIKMEGLDPDFEPGSGDGAANDGRFLYTLGTNYFFTPRVSILVNYSVLQPITKVPGEDELTHDIDALWRMAF